MFAKAAKKNAEQVRILESMALFIAQQHDGKVPVVQQEKSLPISHMRFAVSQERSELKKEIIFTVLFVLKKKIA